MDKLFESDRYFTALTESEREMSFRTEQSLYYLYYKMTTQAMAKKNSTFLGGISRSFRVGAWWGWGAL